MDATSYTSPPSCAESQDLTRALEDASSIEKKGDLLIKYLESQKVSRPCIKAIMKYAVSQLHDVRPFISESVKRSAFNALTKHLRMTLGENEFERMASSPRNTVGDLGLEEILDARDIFKDDSEIFYIARKFIESRVVDFYESNSEFSPVSRIFDIIYANHCNMLVYEFLNRINPDFPDISSLTLSEKS